MLCAKCNTENYNGVAHCENCNACIRPLFLGILTVAGIAGGIMGFLGQFLQVEKDPQRIFLCLYYCGVILTVFALRQGSFFGWLGVQVLWGINILGIFYIMYVFKPRSWIWIITISLVITCILLSYLHKKNVKEFCDV